VWGAGQNGKLWLRDLPAAGFAVPIVVELDPRKLGQRIHGALAVPPEQLLERRDGETILTCVGAPGGREVIRDWMLSHHLVEGQDWWAVC